jgi:hypothetical protein
MAGGPAGSRPDIDDSLPAAWVKPTLQRAKPMCGRRRCAANCALWVMLPREPVTSSTPPWALAAWVADGANRLRLLPGGANAGTLCAGETLRGGSGGAASAFTLFGARCATFAMILRSHFKNLPEHHDLEKIRSKRWRHAGIPWMPPAR